jgi:hypothetical protein
MSADAAHAGAAMNRAKNNTHNALRINLLLGNRVRFERRLTSRNQAESINQFGPTGKAANAKNRWTFCWLRKRNRERVAGTSRRPPSYGRIAILMLNGAMTDHGPSRNLRTRCAETGHVYQDYPLTDDLKLYLYRLR